MAETTNEWKQQVERVGDVELAVIKGGQGRPLLVLHEEMGHPGWLKWHSALARDRTLLIPQHPGFGATPMVEWLSNMRDLACFYARYLHEQKLAPIDVIGFSLGGWLAAEMAVNNSALFRRMILVAPMGIRPPTGQIMDMFTVSGIRYVRSSVLDSKSTPEFSQLYGGDGAVGQFEAFDEVRAMSARLAWQPYMHNPSLPHLLEDVSNLPSLLIWGKDDAVVPISAGEVYTKRLRESRLAALDRCGHRPEIEQTQSFVREVTSFLA
jgi:pimeloyl-ACP methyl ester carboxylesterase